MSSQSKLSIQNLSKSFDELIALDKCSFEVEEGSVVSIVGPSGCGKTTLLWSISGLITPSAGKILLDEEEVTVDELVRRLQLQRETDSRMGVIVRGAADGSFQNVATVLGACRQAGGSDMGISVRPANKLR